MIAIPSSNGRECPENDPAVSLIADIRDLLVREARSRAADPRRAGSEDSRTESGHSIRPMGWRAAAIGDQPARPSD